VLVSSVPPVGCVDWVTPSVGVAGAAGAGAGFCEAGADPPPVGTLSTYSFGAEVGSVVSGGGVVSVVVGVVSVGVVSVVVCAGVVCAGAASVVVCPYAAPPPTAKRTHRLVAAARAARRVPVVPVRRRPPARRGVGASVMHRIPSEPD
jgi:hypothetical protein